MTRAQGLSDFAGGLGDTLKIDGNNNRVGINSTVPTQALDVDGNLKVSGSITGDSFTGIDVTSLKDTAGGSVKVQANASGAVVTGVITATTFDGNVTGTAATFTGNVSVGGVLTYEDVTNIDSVGIITARSGIEFGASGVGGTITATGQAEFVGIVTARSGVKITGGELTLVGTAFTVSQAGVVTATSFVGDGSGLSGVESWNQFDTWLYSGG
jgi:hypothetical protein